MRALSSVGVQPWTIPWHHGYWEGSGTADEKVPPMALLRPREGGEPERPVADLHFSLVNSSDAGLLSITTPEGGVINVAGSCIP